MNKHVFSLRRLTVAVSAVVFSTASIFSGSLRAAETETLTEEQEAIKTLQERIVQLETTLDQRLGLIADAIDDTAKKESSQGVHVGGYGEMHYRNLDEDGVDSRELDLRRMVLFFGYEFNHWSRFISEFEVEHALVSSSSRGAVEVEQAYIEIDLNKNMHLKTGVVLMPIGIISETHEPTTFYGVDRPIIETTIIPTTWYSAGIAFNHQLDNGVSYDVLVTEGLKTDDPNSDPEADPFDLKAGKQKASFADAFDLAITARARYRGASGLELALYTQYQPDLDQSAVDSYAESATLVGGHAIYQIGDFTTKALYASWMLDGDDAKAAGKDIQAGGYVELSWKPVEKWGVFVRQSAWTQQEDVDASQTDIGVNFYPHDKIVFKADIQSQNDDAGNVSGFSFGAGYYF